MKVYPVFKKEMCSYFGSPIAYIVLSIFSVICGYFFYSIFGFFNFLSMQAAMNPMMAGELNVNEGVLRPLFSNISVIMLLMMPLLTMRLFSEEKKSGTIELLLTYPVRDGEVLVGKYLAALAVFAIMLVTTLLYPVLLTKFGEPEAGPILSAYLGLLLLGASFIAIGILASSMTENQIIAAVVTFGALLIFWIIGWSTDLAGPELKKVLSHLSIIDHFDNFSKGVIDTKDVVFYLNFIVLFLFLTMRSLESKRWRG